MATPVGQLERTTDGYGVLGIESLQASIYQCFAPFYVRIEPLSG